MFSRIILPSPVAASWRLLCVLAKADSNTPVVGTKVGHGSGSFSEQFPSSYFVAQGFWKQNSVLLSYRPWFLYLVISPLDYYSQNYYLQHPDRSF